MYGREYDSPLRQLRSSWTVILPILYGDSVWIQTLIFCDGCEVNREFFRSLAEAPNPSTS